MPTLDCGICIAGGLGGDSTARQKLWIIAPSSGFGSLVQPYVIYERVMPPTAGGAAGSQDQWPGRVLLRRRVRLLGGRPGEQRST